MFSEIYTELEFKSGGSFGFVFSAVDTRNKQNVAIKLIRITDPGVDDFKSVYRETYKRIFREIDILNHIHSNYSLQLLDIYKDVVEGKLTNVRIVMPLMDYDLRHVTNKWILKYMQIVKIMYQILLALKYLDGAGIIHRDLKPSNIGINENLDLRLLDFGLARQLNGDMTEYVVTRWYRPIDVFCDSNYSLAVDIWSAGCIYAELFLHRVLFKGTSQNDQVTKIIRLLGFPELKMLRELFNENQIRGLQLFQNQASSTNRLDQYIRKEIEEFVCEEVEGTMEGANEVITLISHMLHLDPRRRPRASEALLFPLFVRHARHFVSYHEDTAPLKYSTSRDLNLGLTDDREIQQLLIDRIDELQA